MMMPMPIFWSKNMKSVCTYFISITRTVPFLVLNNLVRCGKRPQLQSGAATIISSSFASETPQSSFKAFLDITPSNNGVLLKNLECRSKHLLQMRNSFVPSILTLDLECIGSAKTNEFLGFFCGLHSLTLSGVDHANQYAHITGVTLSSETLADSYTILYTKLNLRRIIY